MRQCPPPHHACLAWSRSRPCPAARSVYRAQGPCEPVALEDLLVPLLVAGATPARDWSLWQGPESQMPAPRCQRTQCKHPLRTKPVCPRETAEKRNLAKHVLAAGTWDWSLASPGASPTLRRSRSRSRSRSRLPLRLRADPARGQSMDSRIPGPCARTRPACFPAAGSRLVTG